jgi:hypothetical protein
MRHDSRGPTFVLAVLAVLLAACAEPERDSPTTLRQTILFEVERIDFNRTPVLSGFYVDREGRVVAWERSHTLSHQPDAESYTETELREKYGYAERVLGYVRMNSLRARAELIPAASRGQFRAAGDLCRGKGGIAYRAFLFDDATGRYTPVLLRREGHGSRANNSTSAVALQRWLASLDASLGAGNCVRKTDHKPRKAPREHA